MAKEATKSAKEGAERERLCQLALGYIPAALIGVITELGIPDLLADGAKPVGEIAAATHANEDALYRMLRTLASFGVFTESSGRRFALTSTAIYLRTDVPASLRGYVRWMTNAFLFRNYAELMHSAKTAADAYLMKSIIHDWDDQRAGVILKNCRQALRNVPRGRLILVEPVIPPGSDPHMSKLADIQMLVLAGGRERTREEFQTLLGQSGFGMTAVVPTQSFVSVVEAVPQ